MAPGNQRFTPDGERSFIGSKVDDCLGDLARLSQAPRGIWFLTSQGWLQLGQACCRAASKCARGLTASTRMPRVMSYPESMRASDNSAAFVAPDTLVFAIRGLTGPSD